MVEELEGTVVYPGVVEGVAVVVLDSADFNEAAILEKLGGKDKVLIVESTNPNMLRLMLRCKGIIAETGGLLSHTAIVAREFKIPCIVGVPKLFKFIKEGYLVSFDEQGVIKVKA